MAMPDLWFTCNRPISGQSVRYRSTNKENSLPEVPGKWFLASWFQQTWTIYGGRPLNGRPGLHMSNEAVDGYKQTEK